MEPEFYTVNELAELLNVTPQQIYNLLKRRVFRGTRKFGPWRLEKKATLKVIENAFKEPTDQERLGKKSL